MEIDFKELMRLIEEVSTDYQKSDRIKKHTSRRMSTKGKVSKDGAPYSKNPPTARAKSAPPGFGFTMEELYRLIDEAFEASMQKADPEKVKAVTDWAEKNDLEVVERKPGLLAVMVEPEEIDGKKRDARQPVSDRMDAALLPLGFVKDTRGGTFGRWISPKGKNEQGRFNQLVVILKPTQAVGGGGAAAARGNEAEQALVAAIEQKYGEEGVQASSAGSGHGSDLTISVEGKEPMTVEVKTTLSADFGQFKMGYDISQGKWIPIETKGYLKNKDLYSDIWDNAVGPYMNQNASFTDEQLASPHIGKRRGAEVVTALKPLKGTGVFKKELMASWFGGKESVHIPFDFGILAAYYRDKGDKFVQISKRGLYALEAADAKDIGVPLFGEQPLEGAVRARIKPHGGRDGIHSFTLAIKFKGNLPKSTLDLNNPQDLDVIVQRYKN